MSILDSTKESETFEFSMRAISNDLKNVSVYGDVSSITVNSEIPYDNENDKLSSMEVFISSIMESMILTIIRESKIKQLELDEIEGKAHVFIKNPLRTLRVIGVNSPPKIEKIEIKIYYHIDDLDKKEAKEYLESALQYDPIYSLFKDTNFIKVDFIQNL